MYDVDPKVLARLIKQEKKGKLIWQKQDDRNGKFETVSNGRWTVIVEEITNPAVRMSLFGVFDQVIEAGQGIEMHYGEIKQPEELWGRINYHPELFMNAATLTKVQIGATGLNPAARFVYDNETLLAIDPEIAELSYSSIVYRANSGDAKGPVMIGEHKEIFTYTVQPHDERNRWESILQKFTGTYITVPSVIEVTVQKDKDDTEYPDIDDETYRKAVAWVIENQIASVSAIQRHFRLGYTDSSLIIDRMEKDGIVGPFNGGEPRAVLMKVGQLQ